MKKMMLLAEMMRKKLQPRCCGGFPCKKLLSVLLRVLRFGGSCESPVIFKQISEDILLTNNHGR